MSEAPLVSVLIPTYNYARFLPAAIESVLAQDLSDFELLISDDASDDDSAAVIRSYTARDRRIRHRVQPRQLGLAGNCNWCLREARGEYVKYLFADDCLLHRYSLGRMLSHLEGYPRAALAASARLEIDEHCRPARLQDALGVRRRCPGGEAIARCLGRDGNLIGGPTATIFRRHAAQRGFDPRLRQMIDLEFWFHLLLGGDLVYDPEPLCAIRVHDRRQTVRNRQAWLGPVESLWITERYHRLGSVGRGGAFATFRRMRIVHRCLYYSRKRSPRTPEILKAEAALAACLPGPWQAACWLHHRIIKPFDNLARWSRRASPPPEGAVPDYLRDWRPPPPERPGRSALRGAAPFPGPIPVPLPLIVHG